jgi:signal peptidase II
LPEPGVDAPNAANGRTRIVAGWLALAVVVIVLDQWTKQAILERFQPGESLYVTSFFNLVLAFNTGAAFSFLAGAGGWQRTFFIAIALIAAVVILYFLWTSTRQRLFSLGLALILGGALGNLWDRVALGHVVDFLSFHYAGWYWPAFNVADSAITCGAAAIIIDSFVGTKAARDAARASDGQRG